MTFSIDTIAQLDHSKEFAFLHQKFNKFNPLKVLRVDQYEIRHSNVLAWLLDPNGNHYMGDYFVKKMLSRLLTKPENEDKLSSIHFLSYMYASFSDLEVFREVKTDSNRFIDLVIKVPSEKLVILIENKFHAVEAKGQLEEYITYVQSKFDNDGYTIIPVFLTLRKDLPSLDKYWVLDYNDILEIIDTHIQLNKDAMSDRIFDFLQDYIGILEEELVEDNDSIELALEVYKEHKGAIDLLFLHHHEDMLRQPRYRNEVHQIHNLHATEQEILHKIYKRYQQTIDYIFRVGSSILRQAFLSFVKTENFPEEAYKAHVQVPNFILPEWQDFDQALGIPEEGYWLGHGLITWFERTWDDRLKINLEVGPIPYENRLRFLNSLESQGVKFRATAKMEGKKYTKIYTATSDVEDWSDLHRVLKDMTKLYDDPNLKSVFKKIALSLEKIGEENEFVEKVQWNNSIPNVYSNCLQNAFLQFAEKHQVLDEHYSGLSNNVSFLLPIFRDLEGKYGTTRIKWWWHNSTFTYWFDRLKDDRLKLTLELGPLHTHQRIKIIENLEKQGVAFHERSKQQSSKYTRLYSQSKVINDWEDTAEVYQEMEHLFGEKKNQWLLECIGLLH
ncbi:MAG: PD-(D/E)XK nuclease family protein [Bacillota bacterium]